MSQTAIAQTALPKLQTRSRHVIQLWMLLALALTADWLFLDQFIGITAPLFLSVIALCAYVSAHYFYRQKTSRLTILIPLFSLLPAIETINPLTMFIGVAGLLIFVVQVNLKSTNDFFEWLGTIIRFVLVVPFVLLGDLPVLRRLHRKSKSRENTGSIILH